MYVTVFDQDYCTMLPVKINIKCENEMRMCLKHAEMIDEEMMLRHLTNTVKNINKLSKQSSSMVKKSATSCF